LYFKAFYIAKYFDLFTHCWPNICWLEMYILDSKDRKHAHSAKKPTTTRSCRDPFKNGHNTFWHIQKACYERFWKGHTNFALWLNFKSQNALWFFFAEWAFSVFEPNIYTKQSLGQIKFFYFNLTIYQCALCTPILSIFLRQQKQFILDVYIRYGNKILLPAIDWTY